VERLQYKEIITPSWKEVELVTVKPDPEGKEEDIKVKVEEDEEDIENMSDLMYKLMHAKAEDEERARWQTPLGRGHGTGGQRGALARERQGRARRLDSCRTEASSGGNTPSNPLSPNPLDRAEELGMGTRPGSPSGLEEPATPINPSTPTLR
jgi:KAT8 regulatory NSL complex subunit 1